MATIRQIEANRRNAQKSTGPRSAEGKARSAMNALKSGIDAQSEIIPGEDRVGLDDLAVEYHVRFQPATPEERCLVDVLIRSDWQLRRLAHAEAQLWRFEMEYAPEARKNQNVTLSSVLECAGQNLGRLQRRTDSIQRNYQRALRELERLQTRDREGVDKQPLQSRDRQGADSQPLQNRDREGADLPERTQFPQTRMVIQPLREPGLHPDSFRLVRVPLTPDPSDSSC